MIRVFVGCAPNGEDAESQAVLEYTLRKHASAPVEITWMRLSRDPTSPFYSDGENGWRTDWWSTPFTGFRFMVPELCAFKGRAIYVDSDFIFRADIAELWNQRFEPGKCVMAKTRKRFDISLWDCAPFKWCILPERGADKEAYKRAQIGLADSVQLFDGEWNCLDGEGYPNLDYPRIKAIHYSNECTQPHLRHAVFRLAREGRKHWFDGNMKDHWRPDLIELFEQSYAEALAAGYTLDRYIPAKLYGDFRIASHANYREHRWARA